MDRIRAGLASSGDDRLDVQVAISRVGWTDADVLVRAADMERVAVGVGVDGDTVQAELSARPDDAQRDLAAVSDQDPAHRVQPLRTRSSWPTSTRSSFSTRNRSTVPASSLFTS